LALVSCPECRSEISDRAVACPRCGYPIAESPGVADQSAKKEAEADGAPIASPDLIQLTIGNTLVRLAITLAVLVALHAGAARGVKWARSHNLQWLHPEASKFEEISVHLDAAYLAEVQLRTGDQCALTPRSCETATAESEAVLAIRTAPPTSGVQALLAARRYQSLYDLANAARLRRDDEAAIAVFVAPQIVADHWSAMGALRFAEQSFLVPAVIHLLNSREEDAIRDFHIYNGVVLHLVKGGHWLSKKGVDLTDLPALSETFCTNDDPWMRKRCELGLLRAAVDTIRVHAALSLDTSGVGMALRETLWEGIDISAAYSQLPTYLREDSLGAFLNGWTQLNAGQIALVPSSADGEFRQESGLAREAWAYLRGLSLETAATAAATRDDCTKGIAEAKAIFLANVTGGGELSFWAKPSRTHAEGIDAKGDMACAQEN